jgi:hypothetical protein
MGLSVSTSIVVSAAVCSFLPSAVAAPDNKLPPKMYPVKPIVRSAAPLEIRKGRFFQYALPPGWSVGEDGQFALTLVAPQSKAITVMVGNAGMPLRSNPGQYIHTKLMALGPQNLQISQPRQCAPISGFQMAYEFDVTYLWRGIPSRGQAKCHIAPAYDSATMAMTAALSTAADWPQFASWLPLVADQVSALNGAAFGARGVMAQNIQNSTAYGDAVREYNNWSQRNWKGVTDARDASTQRNQESFRESLGQTNEWVNPYDTRVPLELSTQYQHYWVDRQGRIVGTDDPTADPNVGSTSDWKKMPRRKR